MIKLLSPYTVYLVCVFAFHFSHSQSLISDSTYGDTPIISELVDRIEAYNSQNPIEKVYLHTDKDVLSAGEDIWFSAYVVLGPFHQYSFNSKVLHIDLINPKNEILVSQTIKITHGRGQGSIAIPSNLQSGIYQLRSYTSWMRNFDTEFFFRKAIKIVNYDIERQGNPDSASQIDLQFYPEGGYLVDGLFSKVAFQVIGSDGLTRSVEGNILDSKGKIVGDLTTVSRGSGIFYVRPESDEKYTAVLTDGSVYPLPQARKEGYVLSVSTTNAGKIYIEVQASTSLQNQPLYLIGLMRGKRYFQNKFEFGVNSVRNLEIATEDLPSGILTLTLFDETKKPLCERLVFINKKEELKISAQLKTKYPGKRDKISIELDVRDPLGNPVSTELSIAITDAGQFLKERGSSNILTNLLLQSDLKGRIPQPNLLFRDRTRATLYELDIVMLTHGWRRYNWQELWNGKASKKAHVFSQGLRIAGTAYGKNKLPMRNTILELFAKSEKELASYTIKTDHRGRFVIKDFDLSGPIDLVFNVSDHKNKPIQVQVALDSVELDIPDPQKDLKIYTEAKTVNNNYVNFSSLRQRFDSIYFLQKTIALDEAVITSAKSKKRTRGTPSTYGITPDKVVYAEDHPNSLNLIHLINKIPGINISSAAIGRMARGGPLWVIDGFPMYSPGFKDSMLIGNRAEVIGGLPSAISHIDVNSVERVEYLRPASASIYGVRGSSGVFLIYTKTGADTNIRQQKTPVLKVSGHAESKDFYSPRYDLRDPANEIPDYRSTLFWDPYLKTDENGKAILNFYNSDNAESMQIDIQGLSPLGIPGTYLQTIKNVRL